jgi:pyruvate/2-oxoacid:ferredoxin oxidoreductase beta subunit
MKKWLIGFSVVSVLSACVTINIYFPAAAAEKAADKIIDEVWQLKQGQGAPASKSDGSPTDIPADAPAK